MKRRYLFSLIPLPMCFAKAPAASPEPLGPGKLPRVIASFDFGSDADYSVAVYRRLPNGTSEIVSHRLLSAPPNEDTIIFSHDLIAPPRTFMEINGTRHELPQRENPWA